MWKLKITKDRNGNMYTLYTDRDELFECDVNVKNASLKDSLARLVLEANDGIKLIFEGSINNGKCKIPIRRMHGIMSEWQKGKIHLELIVENVYFKPWASSFIIEKHTNVKIEEVTNSISESPNVNLSVHNEKKTVIQESKSFKKLPKNIDIARIELQEICHRFSIGKGNIKQRKNDFREIVMEYFRTNTEYVKDRLTILKCLSL